MTKQTVLVIFGPTASGKSSDAMKVANKHDCTIINADSLQIYKDLRILTSRPSIQDEKKNVHKLYGILSGGENCSVSKWLDLAKKEIKVSLKKNKLPIIVGGTGMYIKGLIDVYDVVDATGEDCHVREHALVKVCVTEQEVKEIEDLVSKGNCRILDHNPATMILELSGNEETVEDTIKTLGKYNILELLRSGKMAMISGNEKKINQKPRTYTGSTLKKAPTHLFFFFIFFQKSFYCVFGCFSAWGTQKQRKNFFGNFLVMTQKATS